MTLNSILKGFNKTLTKLETLQAKNDARMKANEETILGLDKENKELSQEAFQAEKVAQRLRELLA